MNWVHTKLCFYGSKSNDVPAGLGSMALVLTILIFCSTLGCVEGNGTLDLGGSPGSDKDEVVSGLKNASRNLETALIQQGCTLEIIENDRILKKNVDWLTGRRYVIDFTGNSYRFEQYAFEETPNLLQGLRPKPMYVELVVGSTSQAFVQINVRGSVKNAPVGIYSAEKFIGRASVPAIFNLYASLNKFQTSGFHGDGFVTAVKGCITTVWISDISRVKRTISPVKTIAAIDGQLAVGDFILYNQIDRFFGVVRPVGKDFIMPISGLVRGGALIAAQISSVKSTIHGRNGAIMLPGITDRCETASIRVESTMNFDADFSPSEFDAPIFVDKEKNIEMEIEK